MSSEQMRPETPEKIQALIEVSEAQWMAYLHYASGELTGDERNRALWVSMQYSGKYGRPLVLR